MPDETDRQRLARLLEGGERSLEELRHALGLSRRALLAELRHLERTLRRAGRRLRVLPAACRSCGYAFSARDPLRAPGRCPRCRSERIAPPRWHLPPR